MSSPVEPSSSRRRWLRVFRTIGRILIGVYALLLVLLYVAQDMLIFPGQSFQGRPPASIRPGPGREIVELKTSDGEKVVALFGPALSPTGSALADAKIRPTILYFYGNAQYLGGTLNEFAKMRRMGLNVLMPDYLGYGLSGGRASEAGCYATADAAYDHLRARPDVDPAKLVIGGFSLGGAVAIDLASRRPAAGLIVSCTFTSMGDMTRGRYPFVPTSLLLRHRFSSREKIAAIRCPILIADGRLDKIIPPSMASSLASACGGPVTRIVLDEAGHDDLFRVAEGRAEEVLLGFLNRLP